MERLQPLESETETFRGMTFQRAMSWGLLVGVIVAGIAAVISEQPEIGFLTWLGVATAVAVAGARVACYRSWRR